MAPRMVVWEFRGGRADKAVQEWESCLEALASLLDLFQSDFASAFRQALDKADVLSLPEIVERARTIMGEMDTADGGQNPGLLEFSGPAMLVFPELRSQMGDRYYWSPTWFYSSHSGSSVVLVDQHDPVAGARLILLLGEGEENLQSSFLSREEFGRGIRRAVAGISSGRRVFSSVCEVLAEGEAPSFD